MWTDMEVRGVDNLLGNDSKPAIIDVHPKRVKKGVYGLTGHVTFNDDLTKYFVGGCVNIRANQLNQRIIITISIIRLLPKYSTVPKATMFTLRRPLKLPLLLCATVSTRIIANF